MADVTVTQFAEVLKVPVERLLAQLDEAGIRVSGADDTISDEAKMELLTYLRKAHGREDAAAPRKITLKRKSQGEIKVASAQGRARTVNVEVRTKKTYLNRSVLQQQTRVQQDEAEQKKISEEEARRRQEQAEAEAREAEQRMRERLEAEAMRRADEEARRAAEEELQRLREARERAEAERKRQEELAKAERLKAKEKEKGKEKEKEKDTDEPAQKFQRTELHVSSDASARFKKKKHAQTKTRKPGQISVASQHGFRKRSPWPSSLSAWP
jgi:translation initiation factor IF-2